jgi:glycosyltransferase involved in cell wall biosynthesis
LYIAAFGAIISLGFFLQLAKERPYFGQKNTIELGQLVVLIPFRDEEKRLQPLLSSINNLTRHPKEYIFINDHSTDSGTELIRQELQIDNYRILDLPEDITGKKRALRHAIEQSESDYILTLDADVEMEADYFENIALLGKADMYVLSVPMIAKKWHQRFYEMDLVLVNAANAGLAGLARPIMASGANLLYKRSTFNEVDRLESHAHAASGDDTYLLRDFRENKCDVRLVTAAACRVTTETPQSFREFIDQRLRWIGKTGDIKDNLSTTLAIVQALMTTLFLSLVVATIVFMDWRSLAILFIFKSIADLFLFFSFFQRIKRLSTWILIPIYELLFPFYTLIMIVLLMTYKPKWKGRVIYEDKIGD